MEFLDGSSARIDLGDGYALTAPGITGTAVTHDGQDNATRGGGIEQANPVLDQVFEDLDMSEIRVIELDVSVEPDSGSQGVLETRTMDGSPGMVLEVPDLGPDDDMVVMVIDDGVVTWSYPDDRIDAAASRGGAGSTRRFVIRQPVTAMATHTEKTTRGFIGAIGKRILRVLVYPITDRILGPITAHFAGKWEAKNRPHNVRSFTRENFATKVDEPLTTSQWQSLAQGRALLFVHGTFSTTHTAFSALSPDVVGQLDDMYNGRVFAFDHPTVSMSPEDNIKVFAEEAAKHLPDTSLEVDIVCHSRGGLVARGIAGEFGPLGRNVSVRHIVFVATPNQGTVLADPDHMVAFLDRYTSALDFAPPGPIQVLSEILEAILVVVKIVGHAGLVALDGLAAQNPRSDFLTTLNQSSPDISGHHAIVSNYEPKGNFAAYIADDQVDKVFDQADNDIVVPTDGVSKIGSGQLPDGRILRLDASKAVWHGDFFGNDDVTQAMLEWLS